MGIRQKFTAISTALLFSLSLGVSTGSILAGDYYPPEGNDPAPEVTVVEFGTGWYLRGDIGYTDTVDPGFSLGGTSTGQDLGNAYSFGIGAGYTVNNFLRFDGTIEQMTNLGFADRSTIGCGTWDDDSSVLTPDVPVTGSCSESQSIAAGATTVMLNAYFDLGNFGGFTPYVGLGGGAAYVRWEDYSITGTCRINNLGDCQNGAVTTMYNNTYTSNTEWKPAAALMAGFSYDLTKNLKLDAGYKFTYIGGGSAVDNIPNGAGFSNLEYDAFNIHQVKIGLRYEIW